MADACVPDTGLKVLYSFRVAFVLVYFLMSAFYLRRSYVHLRAKCYNEMRMTNQVRQKCDSSM